MKSNGTAMGCVVALLVATAPAFADPIQIDVEASPAPNVFGSPSWAGYLANSLHALENGLLGIGDRTADPTAYETITSYAPEDIMVTSFNSWRGVANPPAPFNNELGNRLHFGLRATGDGVVRFRLEDVSFAIESSDGVLNFAGNFAGSAFSGTRFGVDWGSDRAKGGGDDTVYAAGNGSTYVDEIVYVGVGNAYWPGGPGDPLTGQTAIDAMTATILSGAPGTISGSYTILGDDGLQYIGKVNLNLRTEPVPEPGTLALVAGVLGIAVWRKRRRRTA